LHHRVHEFGAGTQSGAAGRHCPFTVTRELVSALMPVPKPWAVTAAFVVTFALFVALTEPNGRNLRRLLRARCQRPRRCGAEQRDELAPHLVGACEQRRGNV
jgi:hypothetical protein